MSARFLAFLRTLVAIWCLIELDPAWAGNCLLTLCGGTGFPGATVYLNFATGQYKGLSLGQMTFTRAPPPIHPRPSRACDRAGGFAEHFKL